MHCISLLVVVAVTVLEVVLGTPLQSYSKNSTETRTVCLLPLDEGPCRGLLPRYYYNRFTQTCEEFAYGGCDGNANNFMFLEDCEKVCSKIKKVPKPCRLDADPGPCRAMFKKFAFNLHTMKCEKFMYGGCYGNDNNFKDEASCLESCAPKRNAPSFCYSPKDEGSCSASVTRYYFNIESKACEEFNYTGCGGNSNNFVKIEDCNSVCKKEFFMSPGLQIKHMKNDSLLIPLNVQETTTHFAIGPQTTPQGTPNSTEVKDTPA